MITAGTVAWASTAPGFSPPGPHPLLVIKTFANDNFAVVFITHSADLLRIGLPLTRSTVPSAFRNRGGPLTDETSVLGLIDDRGHKRVAIASPSGANQLSIGSAVVYLSMIIQLPNAEWLPLRERIIAILR